MHDDPAHRWTLEELAQRAWDEGTPLRELLTSDERAAGLDLDAIFDYGHYTQLAGSITTSLKTCVSAPPFRQN